MTKVNPIIALIANLFLPSSEQAVRNGLPEIAEVPVIQALRQKDGAVVLILGRRESGKTVLAQRMAQVIGRPTYAISPEEDTPPWIRQIKLEQLAELPPPHSTLILDDLPVYASQHDYHDPYVRVMEQLIPVVRHRRKLILIFSAQSSSLSDRYTMDSDVICLKPANLLFLDLERPSVGKLYRKIMPMFDEMSEVEMKRHAYLFSQGWSGMIGIEKPTY